MDSFEASESDNSVIPAMTAKSSAENIAAIDKLVTTSRHRLIVAWGKWLGFTPQTVKKYVELAEIENAPETAIQKIDGKWLCVDSIANDANRSRVEELARIDAANAARRENGLSNY